MEIEGTDTVPDFPVFKHCCKIWDSIITQANKINNIVLVVILGTYCDFKMLFCNNDLFVSLRKVCLYVIG